jgi:CcmD family protein
MGDLWYLALAYGVIWLGLFGYLFRLTARAEGLSREVNLLRGMLNADPPQSDGLVEADTPAEAGAGPAGGEA